MAKTKRVKRQLRKKSTFRKKGKGKDHEIAFLLKQKLSNVAKTYYDNDNAIVGNLVSRLPRDQIDKDAYERRLNKALAHNMALLAEQEAEIKDFNASRKDGPSRGTRNRAGPRTHPELKKLYLERDHTKQAIILNQHELRQLRNPNTKINYTKLLKPDPAWDKERMYFKARDKGREAYYP